MAIQLKPLNQQVIVITGASSGIGLATARAAAKQGAKLVLAARSKQTLDALVKEIEDEGRHAVAVQCDVADRQQLEQVAGTAIAKFGRIDTWVNNAGIGMYARLGQASEEDNRRLFDTNFWGVVNGSIIALRHLEKNGGALINIGSEASEAYVPYLGMYVASKHAVKGFTDALRVEVEQLDKAPVSVTLIQPTAVDTPFDEHARNYMPEEPNLPQMGMVDPEDVAKAILDAAVKPTRYHKVGTLSKVNTFTAKNFPGVADRMSAKQSSELKRDEPAKHPEGSLHQPSTSGKIHGGHKK